MPKVILKKRKKVEAELIVEVGTEELPASFVSKAVKFLREEFEKRLSQNRIPPKNLKVFGTPRRLIVTGILPKTQSSLEELVVGPPYDRAFDENGKPTKAGLGFARSQGVSVEELTVVENPKGKKGKYVAVKKLLKGKPSEEVLRELIPDVILSIPLEKSMRWDSSGLRFIRPIRWLVAVFDGKVVPFSLGNVESGNVSYGHKFLSPEGFEVKTVKDFILKLKERCVIPDQEERKEIIRRQLNLLSEKVNCVPVEDEDLIEEVAFLTEHPVGVLGSFEKEFLKLPEEVIKVVLKEHQRFFVLKEKDSLKISNYFVGFSDSSEETVETVRSGYEKVVRARLSDALFFYTEDTKKPLADYVEKLKGVVFHEKLGTMFEKTQRLIKLSSFMADLLGVDREVVERASFLSKADLLTEMVKEFPELQGIMGEYYALNSGEKEEVAKSLREQYLPRFWGDVLPETVPGVILSVADKLDTITGFVGIGLKPSATSDPFALRRNAIGIISTLVGKKVDVDLEELAKKSVETYREQGKKLKEDTAEEVCEFLKERLKVYLKQEFSHDVVESVIETSASPYDVYLRAKTVETAKGKKDFEEAFFTMKRVKNIVPQGFEAVSFEPEEFYEKKLWNAYLEFRPKFEELIEEKRYKEALELIKELGRFVGEFFDCVLVMHEDETVRNRRLSILWNISSTISKLLDVGKLSV